MGKNRNTKKLLLVIGAIIFLALFYISGIRNAVIGIFGNILAPIISPAIGQTFSQDVRIEILDKEVSILRQENTELKDKLAAAQILLEDRDLSLQYKADKKIPAEILWYSIFPGNRIVRINRGRNDQVQENMAVVASGGILVGKTINVTNNSADVLLIDDPRFSISVKVGEAVGLLSASPQGAIGISLVGADANIESGFDVRTAGRGDALPQDLLIGRVSEVVSEGAEPFFNIKVQPLIDIKRQTHLFVIDVIN